MAQKNFKKKYGFRSKPKAFNKKNYLILKAILMFLNVQIDTVNEWTMWLF